MIMRLISGLIYPTSGKVYIGDKKLGEDISFPESIGIMLENPAFLNGYNGFDNLRILADIKSVINEDRICEVMKLVGLEESGLKKYKKFSLGMKQRLGIAAAIMEKPQILLLDEPTNSLDEDGIEMVKNILKKEKERGATVVFSCHDTQLLEELSDEIIEIQTGQIKTIYNPKEKIMRGTYVQGNQ
jgi:ABC-2 type transport system ATP-binding protein